MTNLERYSNKLARLVQLSWEDAVRNDFSLQLKRADSEDLDRKSVV